MVKENVSIVYNLILVLRGVLGHFESEMLYELTHDSQPLQSYSHFKFWSLG